MSGVKLGRKFNRMKQAAVPAAEASTVTTPSEKTQDSQAPRLDLSHGFVRNIVYNQVIRDEYDKLVKNATDQKKSTSSRTSNSKEPMLYVPPHIRQVLQTNTTSIDMHKKDDSAEGFAKLMARRMGLDDEDHQHRLFARLTVEMKKYEGCGCQQHS
uniref:Uncharacterized protein n=1 Tax=Parascaris univalens TaxID=6257 RepID=A0A915B100_PARUN